MPTINPKKNGTTAAAVLKSKTEAGIFDVFLCHNSRDKPKIKEIAEEPEAARRLALARRMGATSGLALAARP